jgi:hypothetical protein
MWKLIAPFLLFVTSLAWAADQPPAVLRLLVGNESISPSQLNTYAENQGLKTYNGIGLYGVEATKTLGSILELGVRGVWKYNKVKETASPSANPQNPYYSSIQQSEVELVARFDLLTTPIVRLDVFGGAGPANTSVDVRTAAGEGNFSKTTSYMASAGGSVGIGWGNIYFTVEVGNEWNKVSDLTRKNFTPTSIDQIDLSGPYVLVGLTFNGLPNFIKPKASSK